VATHMQITNRVILQTSRNGYCSKSSAPQTLPGKAGRVFSVSQCAASIVVNSQVTGTILAKN
jgi:hypothetical protein